MSPEQPHPAREDLFAYRDGELPAERRVRVEAHVLACRSCRDLIDEVSSLEAELRRRPDDAGDEYFERMPDEVLTRIAAAQRVVLVPPPPPPPAIERRKPELTPVRPERLSRAPGVSWAAFLSAGSAAAAVIVVLVVLARQGTVWRAAPGIAVLEDSAPDAARAGSDSAVSPARGAKQNRLKDSAAKQAPIGAVSSAKRAETGGRADEKLMKAETDGQGAGKVSGDLLARSEAELQAKPDADRRAAMSEKLDALPRDQVSARRAPAVGDGAPGDASLPSLLERYGLPPTWGPGVSDELVLRVESPLKSLYRTGGAASALDSARVRLYLAEAARLRAGASPDSAAAIEVIRHYRRAEGLAHNDAQTAEIIRLRLEDFLSEVESPPAESEEP